MGRKGTKCVWGRGGVLFYSINHLQNDKSSLGPYTSWYSLQALRRPKVWIQISSQMAPVFKGWQPQQKTFFFWTPTTRFLDQLGSQHGPSTGVGSMSQYHGMRQFIRKPGLMPWRDLKVRTNTMIWTQK